MQASAAVSCEELDFHLSSWLPHATQRRFAENSQRLHRWFEPVQDPHWQFREYLEHGGMW
jgi:hypothetical protein